MMAWQQKQRIYIISATECSVEQLDNQMWQYPENRFMPHTTCRDPMSARAPVVIGTMERLKPADVVINLSPDGCTGSGKL